MMQSIKTKPKLLCFYLPFFIIVFIGIALRLDQFTQQVLLDDEWHAIHQLLKGHPEKLFLTFGHADFSIPLALLYWLQLNLFGLSETGMRWPMMLAGITTIVVFPLYIRKFFDNKTTLVFSLLLSLSPLLVIYSRTARPYSITLLLSLMAIAAFHQFVSTERSAWKPGLTYFFCALLSVWLHLITLPMIAAPFIIIGVPAMLRRDWKITRRIIFLGGLTTIGLLILVLPPLFEHPEALTNKFGVHTPELRTLYGALFTWLGVSLTALMLTATLLAILGARQTWQKFPLLPSLIAGIGLTLVAILVSQPAWIRNPLTFSRYLLPMIPFLLLLIAVGSSTLSDILTKKWIKGGKLLFAVFITSWLVLTLYYSPLRQILANPNSNSLHSIYQMDFRAEYNPIIKYQKIYPVSPFWQLLASLPPDSLKISASPFYFETYYWDAARWEQISHQRIMPGYLTGFCLQHRWGEVPDGQGYSFQNVGFPGSPDDMLTRNFDLVIFQKPVKVVIDQLEAELGTDTKACEKAFRKLYSEPLYEDKWLLVFPLSEKSRILMQSEKHH